MGWLAKILRGPNHRLSRGQYHGKYEDEIVWEGPRRSADRVSDFDKEELDRAIALSIAEEDAKGKKVVDDNDDGDDDDDEVRLQEDEELAKAIQESWNLKLSPPHSPHTPSPPPRSPRYDYGSFLSPYPFMNPSAYRMCAGCHSEIGHGRYLSCMGAVWHPECFLCHACNHPISDYEFSLSDNRPFHKSCYKDLHHPKCDVCKHFIPTNGAGLIEYRAHPFWHQKYCPTHEHDGTPRCCSCERMEGHHHMPETRGLCLSEEQTVSTILRRPTIGGYRIVDMFTEPYKLVRKCEVTAILILYGLPRLLTGSILAHEMMHAWLRLRGYPNLSPDVEEGICQVLAHMWLDSEIVAGSGSNTASTSSSSSSASSSMTSSSSSSSSTSPSTSSSASSGSSKKGKRSEFEKKLGEFFKHQIESDSSAAYGDGFREGNKAVLKYGLKRTLDHIRLTGSFPC
ncbi:hypothetical protein STAS_06755 [Striga asiatica]|uniref:LIM zinc-binding domain-containing protein n=1 Tax=Striga asiatica TaxID=4170 RepID=A0A5A7PE25_STRAF|nr:hypothetical protein STAS_06755 [Striga asiatica]